MWTQRLMWIAWPAFLMAGVLEMLVFALVDPHDLHWFGQPVPLSREGVYTLAFFCLLDGHHGVQRIDYLAGHVSV